MKDFLIKVLGVTLLLSVLNPWYLTISGTCILAVVINSYLEVREKSYKKEEERLESLKEEIRQSIKDLQSEQNVLKLKVQNLTNPGRKL